MPESRQGCVSWNTSFCAFCTQKTLYFYCCAVLRRKGAVLQCPPLPCQGGPGKCHCRAGSGERCSRSCWQQWGQLGLLHRVAASGKCNGCTGLSIMPWAPSLLHGQEAARSLCCNICMKGYVYSKGRWVCSALLSLAVGDFWEENEAAASLTLVLRMEPRRFPLAPHSKPVCSLFQAPQTQSVTCWGLKERIFCTLETTSLETSSNPRSARAGGPSWWSLSWHRSYMSGLTKAVSRGAQGRDHSILQPFSQTHLRSFVSGMGCWCSSWVGYRVPGPCDPPQPWFGQGRSCCWLGLSSSITLSPKRLSLCLYRATASLVKSI